MDLGRRALEGLVTINPVIEEDGRRLLGKTKRIREALDDSTVLLAGAGGFLGAYLLDVLAVWTRESAVSCRVLAVDNFASGIPERIRHLRGENWLRIIEHDLRQPLDPSEPVNWIIHAASIASPTFYRRFPLETIDVNVAGTRHLLDLARSPETRAMLFLSSSEIYGDPTPDAIPTPEDYRGFVSCTGPRACYDESKRLGETLCTTYHRQHSTPVRIGRPFNVYGPGQRLDDRRIIPDMVSAALAGGPLVLLSDGTATRSFCYARDAASAILTILCMGRDGEAYNLGNDAEELTMLDVARTIKRVSPGNDLTIEHRVSPDTLYLTDNPQRRKPDLRKLRALEGWTPEVSLEAGLERTLRSYREAPGGLR